MLPKKNRLKNTKEIDGALKRGKGVKEGFLFLKFIKNDLDVNRFAFIVSKKSVRKAVDRNRAKRRLRDIIKREAPQIIKGFDLVIVAQKGIENIKFQEIKESAGVALRKANLLI